MGGRGHASHSPGKALKTQSVIYKCTSIGHHPPHPVPPFLVRLPPRLTHALCWDVFPSLSPLRVPCVDRAMVRDSRVLVLDEISAALDSVSEAALHDALTNVLQVLFSILDYIYIRYRVHHIIDE